MSFGRAFRLVAVALGAVTLVLAVVCGVTVLRTRSFLAGSTTAPGQVVALDARQSCDHDQSQPTSCTTVYAPRVRFVTADGRTVVFVAGTASSSPSYAEGDRVTVRYRPEAPAGARIDSVTGVWLATIITGALTLVFGGMTAVWVVLAKRFRKE